jgi:hypothetical protein
MDNELSMHDLNKKIDIILAIAKTTYICVNQLYVLHKYCWYSFLYGDVSPSNSLLPCNLINSRICN